MREIKFRGLGTESRIWHYGDLVQGDGCVRIGFVFRDRGYSIIRSRLVSKETIGQYTGLKDKNNNAIYEGDIVRFICSNLDELKSVWNDELIAGYFSWSQEFSSFCIQTMSDKHFLLKKRTIDSLEVIGNIHENPEFINNPVMEEVK